MVQTVTNNVIRLPVSAPLQASLKEPLKEPKFPAISLILAHEGSLGRTELESCIAEKCTTEYPFFGEFNPQTALGTVIVKDDKDATQ